GELGKLPKLKEELLKKEKELEDKRVEISRLSPELKELEGAYKEYSHLSSQLNADRKEREAVLKSAERLSGELKAVEGELEKKRKKLEEEVKVRSALAKLRDSIRSLSLVEEGIHPQKGFLQDVRSSLLPAVSFYCKEFFSKFEFEFGEIEISEDFTVSVGVPGRGTMTLEELSGGQQIAFAIALRFALARHFSQSFDLLVLDEPTIHLDQQRRLGLTELISSLKELIPQMLIVTHDHEIEIVADEVIRVRNVGGYSEVKSEG
ncbi:MAG: AAA family ATPase, partial [Desulfurobacteriaceae bacterium]